MHENTTGHVAVVCHVLLDAADHLHRLHLVSTSLPNHEALGAFYGWAEGAADQFAEQALALHPRLNILPLLPPLVNRVEDSVDYVVGLMGMLNHLAATIEDAEPILYATLTTLIGDGLQLQYRLELSVGPNTY